MLKNIINIYRKFLFLLKKKIQKKIQSNFFNIERFNNLIEIYKKKKFFILGNIIICYNKLNNELKIDLKNKSSINLFVVSFENNVFEYFLDEKKFQKKLQLGYVNYLKIPINNETTFEIKQKNNFTRAFHFKKNAKKNLILLLMVDGLSKYMGNQCKRLRENFVHFENFYANSEWTLPSYSSLISGLHASSHMNFNPRSYYSKNDDKNTSKIKSDINLYKFFSEWGYITGSYSSYHRINPTYGFFDSVDHGRYCKEFEAYQISNEIINQINFFDKSSNLIFAHFMDAHHPLKGFRSMNYFNNNIISDENFDLKEVDKIINENLTKGNVHKYHGSILRVEKVNAYLHIEDEILKLINNINLDNFDDYTIIIFGDHGIKINDRLNYDLTLHPEAIETSLFVKDKKFNNFDTKKKLQTIDIFPSLVDRYYDRSFLESERLKSNNSIFLDKKNDELIHESIYPPYYQILVRLNKQLLYSKFNFNIKENKITKHISNNFLNDEFQDIKISKDEENKLKNIAKNHILKSNLNYQSIKKVFD